MRSILVSVASVVGLVACGGGGGGSGSGGPAPAAAPLPITAANYESVAQQSVTSAYYLVNTSQLAIGAQFANEQVLIAFASYQAERLQHWFSNAPLLAGGATVTQTEACSGGGTITATLDDSNGNNEIDAGESARLDANQCVESGATVNGTLTIAVTALTGNINSNVYSMSVTLGLSNLSASLTGGSMVGNGSLAISANFSALNRGTITLTASSFEATGRFGGTNTTVSLQNVSITETRTPAGSSYTSSARISGTVASTTLDSKSVTLATVNPLVTQSGATYPSSGQVTATGATGSRIRLTAQSASTALIELDADGDGIYEKSVTKPWSQLI